jgi:hypothetical protein
VIEAKRRIWSDANGRVKIKIDCRPFNMTWHWLGIQGPNGFRRTFISERDHAVYEYQSLLIHDEQGKVRIYREAGLAIILA